MKCRFSRSQRHRRPSRRPAPWRSTYGLRRRLSRSQRPHELCGLAWSAALPLCAEPPCAVRWRGSARWQPYVSMCMYLYVFSVLAWRDGCAMAVVAGRGGCGLAWSRPSMRAVLPGVWSRLRRALRVLGVGVAACARGDGGVGRAGWEASEVQARRDCAHARPRSGAPRVAEGQVTCVARACGLSRLAAECHVGAPWCVVSLGWGVNMK